MRRPLSVTWLRWVFGRFLYEPVGAKRGQPAGDGGGSASLDRKYAQLHRDLKHMAQSGKCIIIAGGGCVPLEIPRPFFALGFSLFV